MSCFSEVEDFVQAHRPHGELTFWASSLSRQGYSVRITCPRGVMLERWVLPQDAEEDLLQSGLLAFPN